MQEGVAAGLEDLGAVGAAVMRVHVPGLALEERRVRAEHRIEVRKAASVQHANVLGSLHHRLGRVVHVGPHRVVVMVAGHDGEGRLAVQHGVAFARRRHLDLAHLRRGGEFVVHDRIGRALEAAGHVVGIHLQALMLPDVAQAHDERDVAALAFEPARDVTQLVQEHVAAVEREAGDLLVV